MDIDKLVEQNLNLVHFVINRWFDDLPAIFEYEDLYQSGCIGLMRAARTYDHDRGIAFSTYAVPKIRGAITITLKPSQRQKCIPIDCLVSLDNTIVSGSLTTYKDVLADSRDIDDDVSAKICLQQILKMLNRKDRELIKLRLLGYTQHEIAKTQDVSQEWVSKRIKNIKRRLKNVGLI